MPRWLLQPTYLLLRGFGLDHHLLLSVSEDRDVKDLRIRWPIQLSFSEDEERACRILIQGLTGEENPRWICLHQRDPAYLAERFPGEDWSYHDYRDTPAGDYLLAAETLAKLGYWVFRMGKGAQEPMLSSNPRVIDYARSDFRTDLLDLFLGSRCEFFISSGSGIDAVAAVFRRPQLYVNYALPFHVMPWRADHLFIYQHFWDESTERRLSLRDCWERFGSQPPRTQMLKDQGVILERNTPLEIEEVVLEMHQRVTRVNWSLGPIFEHRQQQFWNAFPRVLSLHGTAPFRARIGDVFLSRNEHLYAQATSLPTSGCD